MARTLRDGNVGEGNVQVFFAGLMIGRFYPEDQFYDLQVLRDSEHKLKICSLLSGQQPISWPDLGGSSWELGIENSDGARLAPGVDRFDGDIGDRRVPPPTGTERSHYFSWVLNLEDDNQFPAHPPTMEPSGGNLQPTIRILNGTLYNSELSHVLHQQRNHTMTFPFGAASNQIGLDLNLSSEQKILLVKTRPGREEVIFRLDAPPAGQVLFIWIINHPKAPEEGGMESDNHRSHFFKYYGAFDLPPTRQYEFWDLTPTDMRSLALDEQTRTQLVSPCNLGSGNPGPLCGVVMRNDG